MYENDDEQKAHNKRWYLAQCKPNATHIAVRNLDNQGFKSFLPLHEGTIRKAFAESIEANSVHGSDSDENAKIEIEFFFDEDEIVG